MDEVRRRLADGLYAASRAHDAAQTDRLDRFRNVERDTAELLGVLIRAAGARRILELGTSNGYSTIWLADAAQATGGRVVSVDLDAGRTGLARANWWRLDLPSAWSSLSTRPGPDAGPPGRARRRQRDLARR
jgi:predicted O-methyltransferase YrrM